MPKSSKATTPVQVTFTAQEVHECFVTEQISRWKEGVDYLYKTYTIQKYLVIIRKEPAGEKQIAEFTALVEYSVSKGEFHKQEHAFSSEIANVAYGHRRREIEAILKQQDYTSFDPTEGFCLACIPYATTATLELISSYTAGCIAFTHYLCKEPNRVEGIKTTAKYYINTNARRFKSYDSEAQKTAERNNYDLWLREPLSHRIQVGCNSVEVWDIGEAIQLTSLDVLKLVDTLKSKAQGKEEDEIKDLKKPIGQDLEEAEDTDSRTLVDY